MKSKLSILERIELSAQYAQQCREKLQRDDLSPSTREMYEGSLLEHTKDWLRLKKQADKQAKK